MGRRTHPPGQAERQDGCIEGLTRVDFDNEADVENYPILTFCYDMLADNMGNLWVLTRNNGIVHLSTKPSPFRFFHLNPAGQELPVNRIQSIFTHDGHRFWLGLQPYGLALYDRDTNQVLYNKDIPGFSAMIGADPIHVQTISAFQELPDHTSVATVNRHACYHEVRLLLSSTVRSRVSTD